MRFRRVLLTLGLPSRAGTVLAVIVFGSWLQNVAWAQPVPMAPIPARPVLLQPGPEQPGEPGAALVEARSATWPLALGMHALIGFEPHDNGKPVAFGVGAELLWKGVLGGFAALLAAEGTPIIAPTINGVQQPSFADRISVPFGMAARPLAPIGLKRHDYWGRLLTGVGLQVGVTVEHLRTSDDDKTTAGLHVGLGVDVPLWGGTREGGIALRLYARMLATPSISLDLDPSTNQFKVYEPPFSTQLFAGVTYYP